ncbi:autotransporter protein [Litorimonas cladophorae]|uniref:Autotransporter protein n=1 Tax=Litorimonas cladophorae TaxID=1220491 RepID=A0A918KFE5_9PROT|nr:autotransporter outer membrane beta-barrel domain-containing protein [Litorimonas cladophorae]GGX61456.1 autotransporter protein [Litorimonas cladophorae]
MRHFKTLALRSTATAALLGALSFSAAAQVSVTDDTSEQILTSTAGANGAPSDVTVDASATVTVDSSRAGVVVDSDNALILDGIVTSDGVNGSTGVELQGGDNRSYTQTGSIRLIEDFEPTDTDDDPFTDGGFAEGEGRTGILISGASPFRGNVELASTSSITVEGNDSFGINLANTPMMTEGLTGNLLTEGQISVVGDRSIGANLASNVIGDVTNNGSITARGTDSQAYAVSGDIQGGFATSGTLSSSGFRFAQRPNFSGSDNSFGRDDLTAEDLGNAGSALSISGDVSGGILLSQRFVETVDADGNLVTNDEGEQLFTLASTSTISQFGSAPAVLINGNGDPIAVGIVAEITDPNDADFDENLQYGFINQGSVSASGIYDDFDATAISVANVTFEGGIRNSGNLSATTFRAPNATDLTDGDGVARVLVLGDQAIADRINNAGVMIASASEAIDEIYFDRANIVAPQSLLAIGIDIGEGASVTDLINTGAITALITGRDGTAVAIRDASGTLRTLSNTGAIAALGTSSDTLGVEETSFDLIAIDLSAATVGATLTQSQNPDVTSAPLIRGDLRFGSGDDSLIASAGSITGDVDFGGGADTLTLSGGTVFTGAIQNTDSLALSVTGGSTLALGSADEIQVSSALIDSTSVFRPVINGATGTASTLTSTGDITFEAGSTINPILNSIVGTNTLSYTLANAGNLTIGDLTSLGAGDSPFLYRTSLGLADDNTLVVTLDLRNPTESIEAGGLGLDQVQAAAFGQVVDGVFQNGAVMEALASTATLGNAFSNITDANDFYAAYNQILPEFSGAAHQFVLANVDGAVGAVGNHLDATRRSPDKPGGAWIQEFFYFADRERAGNSEQYRGTGFGFAGGIDTSFGPFHAVGVNAGFASTEVEDVVGIDDPLDVKTYQLGAYAGYESNGFNFDVFGGVGHNEFEQNRRVIVGDFGGVANADWSGLHANGAVRAGYTLPISEKFWARPSLSVDYLYLNEYGHTDSGTQGIRLRVDGRRTETAAATAMLNVGAKFQGKRTWLRPSVRVGYRNEFISDPTETSFRFTGLQNADGELFDSELARLRAFAMPDQGIILGFTMAAGSQYSSIGFDFDSDIRDGFIRHTGRVVIRLLF